MKHPRAHVVKGDDVWKCITLVIASSHQYDSHHEYQIWWEKEYRDKYIAAYRKLG